MVPQSTPTPRRVEIFCCCHIRTSGSATAKANCKKTLDNKMNSTLTSFFEFPDETDPEIHLFPLLDSQWPITVIIIGYLIFILKLGKILMEHREPYNLKNVLIAYNIFQVTYNAILFGFGFYYLFIYTVYDKRCMLPASLDHPLKYVERYLTYGYYINKICDLLDTVFFVLRKSYKQITVLHVYHHTLVNKMNSTLNSFFELPAQPDPYRNSYPICGSAWSITAITTGYLLFVLKLGKIFMRNRKPYNLKNVLIAYNIFQVIYNSILFGFGVYFMIINPAYDRRCINFLPLDHPLKYVERWLTYGYYVNKIIDLLDTVFYVLRKSYKQITVLHVYHHVMMIVGPYLTIRFYGFGGQYVTMGFFNTFVHAVMYSYYCISAMYPDLKGNLWWKKLDHPHKNIERYVSYAFFINKTFDLLDTVFFVLRKSYKQITVLHVYHHVMMVYTCYWVIRFYGFGGQYGTMGLFNSFIHSIMYFYYFISATYPELKGNLWWKKFSKP
ncbi:hypothetical protein ACLKA7_014334 [Drosophila subpalustris]